MNKEQTVRKDEFEIETIKANVAKKTLDKAAAKQKPALYLAPLLTKNAPIEQPHSARETSSAKRVFDLGIGGLLLFLTAPLFVIIAFAIRLTSKGPIILRQTRLTDGGKKFSMYKFRSMMVDAESRSGPVLAQKNDRRITPLGKILRTTRLDELPQLLNVIRGDMSLVGPRPERPEIAAQLRTELPHFDRRLEVKAGLTGLAQVKMGYCSCPDSYRRKLAFDRLYVRHQSMRLDSWIAFRTIWVMLTGRGAR
jgi:lipopolysaccharide/colanic/teichoic acid biosynthesis glycosyltransferase